MEITDKNTSHPLQQKNYAQDWEAEKGTKPSRNGLLTDQVLAPSFSILSRATAVTRGEDTEFFILWGRSMRIGGVVVAA